MDGINAPTEGLNFSAATGLSWRKEFQSFRNLSSDKWDHYLDVYDHVLSKYYGQRINFLEIGVQGGQS